MNENNLKVTKGIFFKNTKKFSCYEVKKPLDNSFSEHPKFILGNVANKWVAYDRVCDHNGGHLILDPEKNTATCPIHKWTLLLSNGVYENSCPKKPLKVQEFEKYLSVQIEEDFFPDVPRETLYAGKLNFDFNAHASVSLEIGSISIITDPWFLGSCFATGWWHSNPPSFEAVERLIRADIIYISHNHPDHLHIPTLEKYVSKDKLILVPNYESKSVESVLRKLGYYNLIVAEFLEEVTVSKADSIKLIIVKSGDDRDDSALLVYTQDNIVLFAVDTNMPNKWVLPKVDILFTPFAGGASGFPSRVENFNVEKKIEITNANRNSVLSNHVKKLVSITEPKFVIPYAGYFTEIERDLDVKKTNIKNSPDDLISFVEKTFDYVAGINPIETPRFSIFGKDVVKSQTHETPLYFLDDDFISEEIASFSSGSELFDINKIHMVGQKFVNSEFYDSLTVVLVFTNDDFSIPKNEALLVDFSKEFRRYSIMEVDDKSNVQIISQLRKQTDNNIEILRVRQSSFSGFFDQGLPLEDLSIGFQIKMFRDPNVYNFKFWDHFTNKEFIGER